jgi:GGDEF domain-containing protein
LELEQARETLAEAFRILASTPVAPRELVTEVYGACEDWARHFLGAGPAPGLVRPPEDDLRQWVQARMALRSLRQAESTGVRQRERDLTVLAEDLLSGLRTAGLSAGQSAAAVDRGLVEVQEMLATGDIQRARAGVTELAHRLREEIAAQREELDRQLETLRDRVRQAEEAQASSETVAVALQRTLVELREALDDAREKMQVDPLTLAYNRGAFDVALASYADIARASGQTLVLALLDLDRFKQINDAFGHQAGDRVLRVFSDLLSRTFLFARRRFRRPLRRRGICGAAVR